MPHPVSTQTGYEAIAVFEELAGMRLEKGPESQGRSHRFESVVHITGSEVRISLARGRGRKYTIGQLAVDHGSLLM